MDETEIPNLIAQCKQLVVQMAVLVMDNVFWKMECTGVPAPTAGLALIAPSHLNSLATTTRITMKVGASLLQIK